MNKFTKKFQYSWNEYGHFHCLLLYFHEDMDEEDEILEDTETIKRFISVPTFDSEYIKLTLHQAREVLALPEFPAEWVWKAVWGDGNEEGGDKEKCRAWVQKITDMLEEEAKKTGKL